LGIFWRYPSFVKGFAKQLQIQSILFSTSLNAIRKDGSPSRDATQALRGSTGN
jgi:hypothetical protein